MLHGKIKALLDWAFDTSTVPNNTLNDIPLSELEDISGQQWQYLVKAME